MSEHYLLIKQVHVLAVIASVSLFSLRGMAMLAGSRLVAAAPLRWLSYGIDTVLLAAALALLAVLRLNPFTTPWLATKLVLLLAYIVLGSLALKRGRTRARRGLWLLAALAVFTFLYGVARMHHPAGWLLLLAGRWAGTGPA